MEVFDMEKSLNRARECSKEAILRAYACVNEHYDECPFEECPFGEYDCDLVTPQDWEFFLNEERR